MAQHTFFLLRQAGEPDRLLVWDTRTLTVGRSQDNALVLAESDVSRRHAIFTREGGGYQVGDHQTGNGTLVNGNRVAGSQPIQAGDTIVVGKLEMELCESDEHPAKRGLRLEYASHLMTSGMVPQGGNPNATMVGIMDAAPDADDEFIIEHNDGTGSDLFGGDELELGSEAAPVRDLDLDFGTDAGPAPAAPAAPAPDPNEASQEDPVERMRRLKSLHAEGLITDEEFAQKRAQVLKDV